MSTSGRLKTPYSNKRAPTHVDTQRNNDWEASSSHTKRLKQFKVGDMLCHGAGEYHPPLQPSLEKMSPTSSVEEQGQRQGDRISYRTANEMSLVSHGEALESAGCPDPMNCSESQPGLTEQPTTDVVPSTTPETRQTLPPAADGFESITVEVAEPSVEQQNGSSQPSSIDSLSGVKNSNAVQPVIKPAETASIPTASEKEQQMAWASRQVENFEAEIQKLKNDATTRTRIVTSIDQEIEHSQKDYDRLVQGKQEEISRVLRELEEQYNKKCEALESKLENLNQSKQTELGKLKRNTLEVSHKETGLTRFQAIIDYYSHEEDRDN